MLPARPALDPSALASPIVGPITHVDPVNGFVGNQTFRLHTPSGVYYLKSATPEAVRTEAWACAEARAVGIPVPTILTAVTTAPAYVISKAVAGETTSATAVITAAGRHLRRLHTLTGTAYGIVADGLLPTWSAFLTKPLAYLDELAGIVPVQLADRLRTQVPPAIAQLPATRPSLLHGDLHPRHLYAEGATLSAIIDWSDTTYGDPLYDLARFSLSGPAATDALLAGYDLTPTPVIEKTFSLYRIVWSLTALHAEHQANGDWFDTHLATITKELSR